MAARIVLALLLQQTAAQAVSVQTAQPLFADFLEKFGKKYETVEEEARRFAVFTENLVRVAELQAAESRLEDEDRAIYSHLTPFADISPSEFSKRHGFIPLSKSASSSSSSEVEKAPWERSDKTAAPPASFDWREKGAVSTVRNQGTCGSCWSFATTANLEGVNFKKTGKLIELSQQQLVDCDRRPGDNNTGDRGCNGGLPSWTFEDMVKRDFGVEKFADYPYTGREGKCKQSKGKEAIFINGYLNISKDETEMAAALVEHGTLAVGINAAKMQFYMGGVAASWLCPPNIDHGVAIVGYGSTWTGTDYWIVKNSWGPKWGEKGFWRVVRGKGACGINNQVVSATMASSGSTVVV